MVAMAIADHPDILQKVYALKERVNAAFEKKKSFTDDSEYHQLILDCNDMLKDIDDEILEISNAIRHTYRLKFPELESIVQDPIQYARVVKKIGNETEVASLDLDGLLLPAVIVTVSITSSTTTGKKLPEDVLHKTMESCERVLALNATKNQVIALLTTQMGYIAPNLSAVVGIGVAAKLVAAAGGLSQLVNMTCVQSLGARKENDLVGFSSATTSSRVGGGGYVEETEIFQSTPPCLRIRVSKLLANKSIIAARVDFARTDPTGNKGKMLEEEIRKTIGKWLDRPRARQTKALPLPVFETKKKRGGRRLRKRKERYGLTEIRKLANRVAFGVAEETSIGGEGYGMIFAKLPNKFKTKLQSRSEGCASFTFNNPLVDAHHIGGMTSNYFSDSKILNM